MDLSLLTLRKYGFPSALPHATNPESGDACKNNAPPVPYDFSHIKSLSLFLLHDKKRKRTRNTGINFFIFNVLVQNQNLIQAPLPIRRSSQDYDKRTVYHHHPQGYLLV